MKAFALGIFVSVLTLNEASAASARVSARDAISLCDAWIEGPSQAQALVRQREWEISETQVILDPTGEFTREFVGRVGHYQPGHELPAGFTLRDVLYPTARRTSCEFDVGGDQDLSSEFARELSLAHFDGPVQAMTSQGHASDVLPGLTLNNVAFQLWSSVTTQKILLARFRVEQMELVSNEGTQRRRVSRFRFEMNATESTDRSAQN